MEIGELAKMHLAKHAWILSITVSNNDNFCQAVDADLIHTTSAK